MQNLSSGRSSQLFLDGASVLVVIVAAKKSGAFAYAREGPGLCGDYSFASIGFGFMMQWPASNVDAQPVAG